MAAAHEPLWTMLRFSCRRVARPAGLAQGSGAWLRAVGRAKRPRCLTSSTWDADEISARYVRQSPREHVLHRPEMYVGSTATQRRPMWVFENGRPAPKARLAPSPSLLAMPCGSLRFAGKRRARGGMTVAAI